ncbi:hypothetical protein GCM10009720_07110 [Yaniella flava]|uniref:Uncharacterized protein n=1 Tax=Yaniella flava TaxID=287930 RepID=A0ABP5FM99_9MICC
MLIKCAQFALDALIKFSASDVVVNIGRPTPVRTIRGTQVSGIALRSLAFQIIMTTLFVTITVRPLTATTLAPTATLITAISTTLTTALLTAAVSSLGPPAQSTSAIRAG